MGTNKYSQTTYALTQILRRYPHLPTKWIGALLGSKKYHSLALTRLHEKGLVAPDDATPFRSRDWTWTLTDKGYAFNGDRGYDFVPRLGWEAHQRASSFAAASFELGARELGLTFLPPTHVLENAPEETRHASSPWAILLERSTLNPDLPVFGLRGKTSVYFHTEIDRSSEPYDTIKTKLRNYREYIEDKGYREIYGIPLPYFIWIIRHKDRLPTIEKAIQAEIDADYHSHFLIKVQPEISNFPPPSGRMVQEEWLTLNGPFNLMEKLGDRQSQAREADAVKARP